MFRVYRVTMQMKAHFQPLLNARNPPVQTGGNVRRVIIGQTSLYARVSTAVTQDGKQYLIGLNIKV